MRGVFVYTRAFSIEMLCIPSRTACCFATKIRFSAHFGPGDAVPQPRILPFSDAICLPEGQPGSLKNIKPQP